MKESKSPNIQNFDAQFRSIIKGIIEEEKYFKEENIKFLMKDILKEIDPLIAKYVKNHIREIAYFILNQVEPQIKREESDNAKTP